MDVFDLYAKISLDTSGYEKNLSGAKSMFVSAGKSISASTVAMGTMIAHGLERAASAVIDLGKSAITASAEVRAETAQFEAAFGELQAAAEGAFSGIEQDTGVLSTRLRTVGTKAFSQFKGAGLDAASALSEMDRYTRLAADAAAYYDMSIEDADARLRSFLRGNTEAGDMIGLFTSETQRNNKALETYGAKWLDLTEAQKQMLMLDIADEIYQQSGAIGQASREADGWENVTGNLRESWRQLLAVVGSPFQEGLTPVIQKLTEFFSDETVQMRVGIFAANVGKVAGLAFDAFIGFVDKIIALSNGETTSTTLESFKTLAGSLARIAGLVLDNVTGFFSLIFGSGEDGKNSMDGISSFLSSIATFVSENEGPIAAIITAVLGLMAVSNPFSLLIAALATIATHWDDIKEFTQNAIDKLNAFISTIIPDDFLGGVKGALEYVSGLIGSIASSWQSLISSMSAGISDVQSALSSGGIGSAISSAVGNAWWNPFKSSDTSISIGSSGATGSFATGLSYVPYNGFRATLHAGETVLNRADATAWRAGNQAQQVDYATMGAVVGEAVRAALEGMNVNIDGQRAGSLLAEPVSRSIAQMARNRRYQMG